MRATNWVISIAAALFAAVALADEAPAPKPLDASAAVAPDTWPDVAVVTLRKAVDEKRVEAAGTKPRSYQAVTLTLRNTTKERMAVDIAGSYLRPLKRGSCQRLGLGPAITPSGTVKRTGHPAVVLLEPDEVRTLDVNTCCLDLGLPAPSSETFDASTEELPTVRRSVLRWWAENPEVPQSAVNGAIWRNAPKVDYDPNAPKDATAPRQKHRSATTHGGFYYELVDGELSSVDADGVLRLLGNGIETVLPTDDGLFSVMTSSDGKTALWRLEMTGERCWSKVTDLDGDDHVRELVHGAKGDLVFTTDMGVTVFDGRKKTRTRVVETTEYQHLSLRRPADDRLTITAFRPAVPGSKVGGEMQGAKQATFELWSLSLETGKAERTREFWNVTAMRGGASGVYALEPTTGDLRKLSGHKFVEVTSEGRWKRIVAVTGGAVWVADDAGVLVALDPETGSVRFRTTVRVAQASAANIDPKTGDLAYVEDDEFRLVRAADGSESKPRAR